MPLDMRHEPIRIPALVYALILLAGPIAVAWLLGLDVREAAATVILGLIAGGGIIARAESVRARVDSPATIEAREAQTQAEIEAITRGHGPQG